MRTITLQEAYDILENASALVVDDNALVYPALSELTGESFNQFLYVTWDDEGQEYSLKFCEEENETVKIVDSSMFLVDEEGDERQITILEPKNMETENGSTRS